VGCPVVRYVVIRSYLVARILSRLTGATLVNCTEKKLQDNKNIDKSQQETQ
jgi:hypothetical protein